MPFALVAPLVFLTLIQPDLGHGDHSWHRVYQHDLDGRPEAAVVFIPGRRRIGFPAHRLAVFCRPYQRNRILTFLDPDRDPLGAGYHVIQSQIAIGSGEFSARAILHGTQNRLDFLPAQHTDFIFAVFSEEWGFVGCVVLLLLLYVIMIAYCLGVVQRAKDRFGALLVFGMLSIIFWHVVINVAMVAGVMPVVGVPLPMVSYGGSALGVDDVRHRRDHQRQHAALCLLKNGVVESRSAGAMRQSPTHHSSRLEFQSAGAYCNAFSMAADQFCLRHGADDLFFDRAAF